MEDELAGVSLLAEFPVGCYIGTNPVVIHSLFVPDKRYDCCRYFGRGAALLPKFYYEWHKVYSRMLRPYLNPKVTK